MKHYTQGFTILELMIALVTVSVLLSIAYPSYIENINKAKRSEAQAALVSLAGSMEEWKLSNNGVYTDGVNDPTASSIFTNQVPVNGGTKTYTLDISQVAANSYTLRATSVNSDRCDPMTYNSLGQKTAGASDCWK